MGPGEIGAIQPAVQFLWERWLSLSLFLPLLGVGVLILIPRHRHTALKGTAIAFSLAVLLMAVIAWAGFDADSGSFQFVEQLAWIPAIGASYHVALDGMSLLLFALTALLSPLALLGTWSTITERVKGFVISALLLEMGMIGVFVARDLFLFYVFWEAMLIPMYLMIGIWGGPRRVYAAVKFILYTLVGSFLMLVAILALYFMQARITGVHTFDMAAIEQFAVSAGAQTWLFLAFTLAFAIKVPLWPFHTWLPDAHVEAPTAGSVLLAGVLLKMGTYGLLRFSLPLFPVAATVALPWMGALAVIGILYGGMVALVQRDIKSLVAYSSVAHLGFIVLGIFSFRTEGISGSILQMVNHGLSTGALFLLVGFIYERRHTRDIAEFGGLARVMPIFAAFLLLVAFSSAGLPGLNGFVGEFLILLAAFRTNTLLAVLATLGVIVAALYLLRMLRWVLFGGLNKDENRKLLDLNAREIASILPIAILIIWIGVFPRMFLRPVEPFAERLAARMSAVQPASPVAEDIGLREVPAGGEVPGDAREEVPIEAGEEVPSDVGEEIPSDMAGADKAGEPDDDEQAIRPAAAGAPSNRQAP